MKITKSLLGKYVEVVWRDPKFLKLTCRLSDVPKGIAALAYYKERGVIDDITDDVVRIQHSACADGDTTQPDDFCYTWTHAALIERITIMEPSVHEPVLESKVTQ